jgi:hypothetical protein
MRVLIFVWVNLEKLAFLCPARHRGGGNPGCLEALSWPRSFLCPARHRLGGFYCRGEGGAASGRATDTWQFML